MDFLSWFSQLGFFLGVLFCAVMFFFYDRIQSKKRSRKVRKEFNRVIDKARSQALRIEKNAEKKAKDFDRRIRRNIEQEAQAERQKVKNLQTNLKEKEIRLEKNYKRKEQELEQKHEALSERQQKAKQTEAYVQKLNQQAEKMIQDLQDKLEKRANLTKEEAMRELRQLVEKDAKQMASQKMLEDEIKIKQEARKKALDILTKSISRYSADVCIERTSTTVPISRESEVKGRIIGREGRNIRAMEASCGVDMFLDETTDSVIISSFDPVRREVARLALDTLIADGRVHPARIEEVVNKVKGKLISDIKQEGEQASFELGVLDVPVAISELLGTLKYRHRETQNLLEHSIEVAFISGLIAKELGYKEALAKRAGLFHDIGHALDHTYEGSHPQAGSDFASKQGETPEVCYAIAYHEDDSLLSMENPDTLLAHIVQVANNLSKNRPGARRSQFQQFVKRLQDLESIGNSFDGVEKTYAIQAGKEIRVIVDSGVVTDEQIVVLSYDIAKKIEKQLNYSKEIKISVLRENRIVEFAR